MLCNMLRLVCELGHFTSRFQSKRMAPRSMIFIVAILLVVSSIHSVTATSGGALSSACTNANMFPSGHGVSAQTSPSPYAIELSNNTYSPGEEITVTLKGSQSFKGFMILALPENDASGSPVGSFVVDGSHTQPLCTNGLTHTRDFSSAPTDNLVLKWTAPDTYEGNIVFYATFVQTMPTFWVKVPSTVLQPYTATATTTTQTTTRTTTQTNSKTTMRLRSTTETGTATYNTTPNSGTRHAGILIAVRDMAVDWLLSAWNMFTV